MSAQMASAEGVGHQRYPLSEAQTGLWYAQRLSPAPATFNTAHVVWFEGALDVDRFHVAADAAAAEAEALCLRVAENEAGVPQQWLDPSHVPRVQVVDLSGHADPLHAAREVMQADRLQPVDPGRDRMAQQRLFVLGPRRFA